MGDCGGDGGAGLFPSWREGLRKLDVCVGANGGIGVASEFFRNRRHAPRACGARFAGAANSRLTPWAPWCEERCAPLASLGMFASREPNAMLLSPQAQCRPYCHRRTSAFESCQRMDQARLTHQPLAFLHPFPSLTTRICQWLPNAACRRRRAAARSYSRPKRRADSHTALLPDARSDSGPQRAGGGRRKGTRGRTMTDGCMGDDGGKSGGGGLDRDAADADAASWRDADAGPKDQSTARCIARVQQAARAGRLLFVQKLRLGWRRKHQ